MFEILELCADEYNGFMNNLQSMAVTRDNLHKIVDNFKSDVRMHVSLNDLHDDMLEDISKMPTHEYWYSALADREHMCISLYTTGRKNLHETT